MFRYYWSQWENCGLRRMAGLHFANALYLFTAISRAGFRHEAGGPWPRGLHQLRASTNQIKFFDLLAIRLVID